MSKEKRRVPKLRFPGFTEDWEQRKLSDILKVNSGKDYKHLEQGDIPVYGTGGYMLSVNESLSNIDAIGIGRKGTIDKPQYLKAPFWTVDTLFYLTALDKHSILFLYYLMQLMPWKKFDESTGVPSLSKTTIDNINGYVPSNPKEEELISTLFNQLDKSITLHQRKLNNLKLKKKALLQKLFPKNGKRYPELRFPGFTDAWEQRKLSDILKVNSGKDYKHLEQGDIPVYGTGGYMLSVNESLSNIDAIGIGRKGTIDKPQYLKAPFWTVDTLFYLTALDKHSILFLYYLMQLMPWKKFDESTGVPSLSKTTIDNINGYVPSNPKEEELISTLFNQLDKSITLHQRKLDHLQLQKKALLQQMFV